MTLRPMARSHRVPALRPADARGAGVHSCDAACGPGRRLARATAAVMKNNTNPTTASYRAEAVKLAAALGASAPAPISNQDATLGVATMDTALSDKDFILEKMRWITQMGTEAARLSAIGELVNHTDPGPGGFYDKLGATEPGQAPHLLPGQGHMSDPSYFFTPLSAGPTYRCLDSHYRLSWQTYAMSYYDARTISLVYNDLDATKTYEAQIVFSFSPDINMNGFPIHIKMLASGVHVWPPAPQEYFSPMMLAKTQVPIPRSVTANGNLTLTCAQADGAGGGGQACKIAAVWLVVVPDGATPALNGARLPSTNTTEI